MKKVIIVITIISNIYVTIRFNNNCNLFRDKRDDKETRWKGWNLRFNNSPCNSQSRNVKSWWTVEYNSWKRWIYGLGKSLMFEDVRSKKKFHPWQRVQSWDSIDIFFTSFLNPFLQNWKILLNSNVHHSSNPFLSQYILKWDTSTDFVILKAFINCNQGFSLNGSSSIMDYPSKIIYHQKNCRNRVLFWD